ncbi:hypothetical protein [Halorientalis sp.]|uniref:hypothetical protein n=1 Tax=Halorientalis sp. TaxID=1931229 RepID=UPI00262E8336|nr:hypothetical protein [Halorientalis sp.]
MAEAGAGAGAVVLRSEADSPAAELLGTAHETTGFVEHHRRHGEPGESGDSKFESRHGVEDAVPAATERALDGTEPANAAAVAPSGRLAGAAADAAAALLDLARLPETADAGETVLLVAYGAGGAGAVALQTGDGVGTAGAKSVATYLDASEETSYAKHQECRESVEYEGVKTT